MEKNTIFNKSFLKWAGSKYRLLPQLLPILDGLIDRELDQIFVEPFVGAANVSLNFKGLNNFILADSSLLLMTMYHYIKNDPGLFIENSMKYFVSESENDVDYFKSIVKKFNSESDITQKVEMFIYLNRNCFNGLMRFNSSGNFNTPFGRYKNPKFPKDEIMQIHDFLNKNEVVLMHRDYKDVMENCVFGDLVYCDPPYLNTFSLYDKNAFNYENHKELAALIEKIALRGCRVVVSNSYSDITMKLYANATEIKLVDVRRSISANGAKRGMEKEILAIYNY